MNKVKTLLLAMPLALVGFNTEATADDYYPNRAFAYDYTGDGNIDGYLIDNDNDGNREADTSVGAYTANYSHITIYPGAVLTTAQYESISSHDNIYNVAGLTPPAGSVVDPVDTAVWEYDNWGPYTNAPAADQALYTGSEHSILEFSRSTTCTLTVNGDADTPAPTCGGSPAETVLTGQYWKFQVRDSNGIAHIYENADRSTALNAAIEAAVDADEDSLSDSLQSIADDHWFLTYDEETNQFINAVTEMGLGTESNEWINDLIPAFITKYGADDPADTAAWSFTSSNETVEGGTEYTTPRTFTSSWSNYTPSTGPSDQLSVEQTRSRNYTVPKTTTTTGTATCVVTVEGDTDDVAPTCSASIEDADKGSCTVSGSTYTCALSEDFPLTLNQTRTIDNPDYVDVPDTTSWSDWVEGAEVGGALNYSDWTVEADSTLPADISKETRNAITSVVNRTDTRTCTTVTQNGILDNPGPNCEGESTQTVEVSSASNSPETRYAYNGEYYDTLPEANAAKEGFTDDTHQATADDIWYVGYNSETDRFENLITSGSTNANGLNVSTQLNNWATEIALYFQWSDWDNEGSPTWVNDDEYSHESITKQIEMQAQTRECEITVAAYANHGLTVPADVCGEGETTQTVATGNVRYNYAGNHFDTLAEAEASKANAETDTAVWSAWSEAVETGGETQDSVVNETLDWVAVSDDTLAEGVTKEQQETTYTVTTTAVISTLTRECEVTVNLGADEPAPTCSGDTTEVTEVTPESTEAGASTFEYRYFYNGVLQESLEAANTAKEEADAAALAAAEAADAAAEAAEEAPIKEAVAEEASTEEAEAAADEAARVAAEEAEAARVAAEAAEAEHQRKLAERNPGNWTVSETRTETVSVTVKGRTLSQDAVFTTKTRDITNGYGDVVDTETKKIASGDVDQIRAQLIAKLNAELRQAARTLESRIENGLKSIELTSDFGGEFTTHLQINNGGVAFSKKFTIKDNYIVEPKVGFFGIGKNYKGVSASADVAAKFNKHLSAGVNTGTHFTAKGDINGFEAVKVKGQTDLSAFVQYNRDIFSARIDTTGKITAGVAIPF